MDSALFYEKQRLRVHIREEMQSLSEPEKLRLSGKIFQTLESMEVFRKAEVLMAYWSLPDEVYTHDFIRSWYRHKIVLLPAISGNDLQACEFRGEDRLTTDNAYGIPEPAGTRFRELSGIDLIIVPGRAFDKNNNRVGRGKAFYDRFLPGLNAFRLGICFDFQLFEHVAVDEGDVPVNQVITEHVCTNPRHV